MSALKIKDQNGQWADVLSIKGEKGDNGQDYILTENDKQEIAQDVAGLVDIPVEDVQVNGESVVTDGVAEIPIGGQNKFGVFYAYQTDGVASLSDGRLVINPSTDDQIKGSQSTRRPIIPAQLDKATFYGLAKASGDTTQAQSSNPVGTYTDDAKASIQSMLGVPSEDDVVTDVQIDGTSIITDGVAEIPIANMTQIGLLKTAPYNGFVISGVGNFAVDWAGLDAIKAGAVGYKALNVGNQHRATFYGLAKAAGDITQSQSSNAVGTYTSEAQIAIKQMLGVKDDYDSLVVEVSGTDLVITGKASYRYNCGELYTLSITPPETGTMDIIFTSGATPTVLTLPNTVKMPTWWAGIETNTTYEMCITDGVYCGVMSWAT